MKSLLPCGVSVLLAACTPAASPQDAVEWMAYGRDVQGTRYLPASGITRDNVHLLEVAWTYRTGEADPRFATTKPPSFQATPIVVDGVMYLATPLGRVIALDPASGRELWTFDPGIRRDVSYGDFASRGVSTWLDEAAAADAACRRTIYVATAQSQLIALDAARGQPCAAFGNEGTVDLKQGLRIPPFEDQAYTVTSPPVVANALVVVGSSIGDNSRPNPASGEIRAFDARTGERRWSWDPIPQDPADPAYRDWRGDLAHGTGAANAWSALSADPQRDLVFIPIGSAAPDYYGVRRLGDNRYANSLVALKLSNGERVWSFQTVHHDLWDYDNASPPALVTLNREGAEIPAVLQATKTGMLFVLHRETGEPIFPVEERAVPASEIPDEEAARTQPFTAVTAPLSPHRLGLDDTWGITEEDRRACRACHGGSAERRDLHAAERSRNLGDPVEHRRSALGRRGRRPRAADRRRAGQPRGRDGAADPACRFRSRPFSRGGPPSWARLRIQHDARDALCHAPPNPTRSVGITVLTASVGDSRRRGSPDGPHPLGDSARVFHAAVRRGHRRDE